MTAAVAGKTGVVQVHHFRALSVHERRPIPSCASYSAVIYLLPACSVLLPPSYLAGLGVFPACFVADGEMDV